MTAQQALTLLNLMIKRLFADEAIPLAGNIAFRTVFSLFPFLIFLTALAGFFGSAELANSIISFLLGVAPKGLVQPFIGEITSILTVPRAGLMSLAAALTVWSAMGGVDSVRVSLNRAYDTRETRPLWLLYAQNVGFVIVSAIGMLAVATLLVVLPAVMEAVAAYAPHRLADFGSLDWWRLPLAVVLLLVGLTAAHRLLPNRHLPFKDLWPGVLLTLVVWMFLAAAFSWYLRNFNSFTSTYASLSGLFATMFFIYLQALVLIFGGEVNRMMMQVRDGKALSGHYDEPITP
jgi:membrane protein